MFLKRLSAKILFAAVFLFQAGESLPLNQVSADLQLDIVSDYSGANPLRLCIGDDSNCYRVVSGYGSYTLAEHDSPTSDPQADDHPFVNHPDDWDYVYMRNVSDSDIRLYTIKLSLVGLGSGDFTLLDWTSPGGGVLGNGVLYAPGEFVPLFDWVREQREAQLWNVYCDTLDTVCLEAINEDDFSIAQYIPWAVREQMYDQGQAGMVKYRPWERASSSECGCDEAFAYYATQFANNIHYSCEFDNNKCSYFRHLRSDGYQSKFRREQMAHAIRLYKVVFTPGTDAGGGQVRTGIQGIFPCLPDLGKESTLNKREWQKADSTSPGYDASFGAFCPDIDDSAGSYTPKVGDLFVRERIAWDTGSSKCKSAPHFMTIVREPFYDDRNTSNPSDDRLNYPVIHKRCDIVRTEIRQSRVNSAGPSQCSTHGKYKWANFFVGEVDHEIDPDGDGPLTSGTMTPANGPNFGFRIALIAVVD